MSLAVCAGMLVGLTLPAASAEGQVRLAIASGRGGGSMSPISKRSVNEYGMLLGLNEEQRQSAQDLYDGYKAEFDAAKEGYDAKRQAAEETMRDEADFEGAMNQMRESSAAFSEVAAKLEASFMGDLKSLLTETQAAEWPRVERHRRRDTGLRQSFYSGAALDLISLVSRTKSDPGSAEFKDVLTQYELEIDRRIQEGQRKMADAAEDGSKQSVMDFDAQQATMKRMGEASLALRDANREYARRLAELMAPEQRAAFEAEVRKRSFPTVYGESHIEQCLKAASEFTDLDTAQRERIAALQEQYRRDSVPLNAAWARAIDAAEEDSGGSMLMQMNAWGNGGMREELKQARADRKDLESKIKQSLEGALNAEQKGRLPAKKPNAEGGHGGVQIRLGGPGPAMDEEGEE